MQVQGQSPSPLAMKAFLAVFIITILLVGRLFWPFLSILILSFLLTGIFQPVFSLMIKKMSPVFASLLTCFIIIVVVFVPLFFFIGALSQEAYALYQLGRGTNLGLKFQEFVQGNVYVLRAQDFLAGFGFKFETDALSATVTDFTKFVGLFLYNKASSWAANIMSFLFSFFMMILTIFFLLRDHQRLLDYILRLLPLPSAQGQRLLDKFEEIAGAVIIGNGICGLIQGILGGFVFFMLDLGPPILWGGVMGILAFLPIFGIGLVLIPAALVVLFQGKIGMAIGLGIFYMILSFSVEYALKPKLVGTQVQMHTLLVFLAIMGGLSVFGFLGIIYGPLIITAFLTMTEIYQSNYDQYVKGDDCVCELPEDMKSRKWSGHKGQI